MGTKESTLKDMYQALLDRIGNPITGTFIVTWLITNWRVPIAIIFGSVPEKDRIVLIEEIFAGTRQETLILTVALPLLFTGIYLVGMPWLKERYTSWLNRHEYRTTRSRQRMIEDLREETEYRDTLRAICAALKKELQEAQKSFQEISDFAINGQDETKGDFYSQIERTSSFQLKKLSRVSKHIEHFFSNYSGELPAAYQSFLFKWKRTLSVLAGVAGKSGKPIHASEAGAED